MAKLERWTALKTLSYALGGQAESAMRAAVGPDIVADAWQRKPGSLGCLSIVVLALVSAALVIVH